MDPVGDALVVKRWTRYGKDRLYVETDAGEKVGFHDLLSGHSTLQRSDLADAFRAAVSAHGADVEPVALAPAPVAPSYVETGPVEDLADTVPWTDLALNRPGQGVRAEAESQLADMRAQSRVGAFLKRAMDVKTDERAFRVGADGEEAVGARLDRLTKHGGRVLHSIPVGLRGSDIDHLVINQGGVYPVNTKRHPGGTVWVGERAILVNGHRQPYLRNSRFEAERVRKVLLAHLGIEVPVKPVLVFLTGTVLPQVTIKQMPPDVLVLDRTDIPGVFKRAPQRLSPETVERVYDVARRSTSWT